MLPTNEELGVEKKLKEEVEGVLAEMRLSVGGANSELTDINHGVVTVQHDRALSNPSACHVDRIRTTKEIVTEAPEDQLKKVVPGFRKVALLG